MMAQMDKIVIEECQNNAQGPLTAIAMPNQFDKFGGNVLTPVFFFFSLNNLEIWSGATQGGGLAGPPVMFPEFTAKWEVGGANL